VTTYRFILCLLAFAIASKSSIGVPSAIASARHEIAEEAFSRPPVVVELFTSEGCSSCPPADALLQKFDTQPYPDLQLIVLSEHVDYWNHIGWTDPYSSRGYSDRQSAYGNRLRLDSVYTPQIIVDGTDEFVGSSSQAAERALRKAGGESKVPVHISAVRLEGNLLRLHLDTGPLGPPFRKADMIVAVALNHAESQVRAGENSGRRLTHVAVVRKFVTAGSLEQDHSFSQDVVVKLDKKFDPADLRVIAFLQEPGPGKILGASLEKLK
jgi:hypothetical protein